MAIVLMQSLEVESVVDVDRVILPPVWRLEGVAQSVQEEVEEEGDEWEEEDLLEEGRTRGGRRCFRSGRQKSPDVVRDVLLIGVFVRISPNQGFRYFATT